MGKFLNSSREAIGFGKSQATEPKEEKKRNGNSVWKIKEVRIDRKIKV
jgi:hypothetical protein